MKKLLIIAFLFLNIIVSGQSFWGDWESGRVTGNGNHNWAWVEIMSPNRFTLVKDSVRPGTYARVEVREGDNPLIGCCEGTERAEVSGMQNADNSKIYENLLSGTQQYTFSVKFDTTWQPIIKNGGAYSWGIFLQLHGPNILATSPALAFSVTDQIRLNTYVGNIVTSIGDVYNLSDGSIHKGNWIDFILTVKYAKDNTGFINIMRRDEGEVYFTEVLNVINISTLQYSSKVNGGAVGDHYWKYGFYRNRQWCTSILYLDGFTRTSCLCK